MEDFAGVLLPVCPFSQKLSRPLSEFEMKMSPPTEFSEADQPLYGLQADSISNRFRQWCDSAPPWEAAQWCRERGDHFLRRASKLRHRLDRPLIVALLGGTGTGKSTLLNAIVGEEIVSSGKERPTTAKPTLVCHKDIDPTQWGIDLSGFAIETRENPFLEQMAILDCPDPDTTDSNVTESPAAKANQTNLARLRAALPVCDILLVTATQQKYRSRRVLDELASAASGARLIFVQTHADRDVDIREDWKALLSQNYETGPIYFIDTLAVIKAQKAAGNSEAGKEDALPDDFVALRQLLTRDLNEEAALRIRQANFYGLAEETVDSCWDEITDQWTSVRKLRERISEERRRFGERLSQKMRDELIRDRRLWESRLVGRVASQWGFSPFSLVLRIYQGLGGILSGALLARARSIPQLAVWGAFEGIRSFRNWSQSKKAKQGPGASLIATWEESKLRESALILGGFAMDAHLPTMSCEPAFVLEESKKAGETFVGDIALELEKLCDFLARKNSRWWMRLIYETLFCAMLFFLLYRPAKNFFYDTVFFNDIPLLGLEFYFMSAFWLLLWAALLLGGFLSLLRRGLDRALSASSANWKRLPALECLFASIEGETNKAMQFRDDLDALRQRLAQIRQQSEKLDKRLGRVK